MKRLLTVCLLGTALVLTSCGGSTSANPHIQVKLVDYMILPMHISVAAGQTVFDVRNNGATPHNFTVRSTAGKTIGATPNLNPGQSATLTLHLTAPTYRTICTEPGHASLGMVGTITLKS